MMERKRLEVEADRLMHACQRAEEAGNWKLHEILVEEWERVESLLMDLMEGNNE
jgi:hypothetical protein